MENLNSKQALDACNHLEDQYDVDAFFDSHSLDDGEYTWVQHGYHLYFFEEGDEWAILSHPYHGWWGTFWVKDGIKEYYESADDGYGEAGPVEIWHKSHNFPLTDAKEIWEQLNRNATFYIITDMTIKS